MAKTPAHPPAFQHPASPFHLAEAIRAKFPNKMLAYNCSPSFNWEKNLSREQIASFQADLGRLGYAFQFVTLAGYHALNFSMFELAAGYRDRGMAAYSELQQKEFAREKEGYTCELAGGVVGLQPWERGASAASAAGAPWRTPGVPFCLRCRRSRLRAHGPHHACEPSPARPPLLLLRGCPPDPPTRRRRRPPLLCPPGVRHQREAATGYFDAVSDIVSGGTSSTTALKGSTEAAQF